MVDYTTCGKPRDISPALTALRGEAARRCGLAEYPAARIAWREWRDLRKRSADSARGKVLQRAAAREKAAARERYR
jgi:hypothetical protein